MHGTWKNQLQHLILKILSTKDPSSNPSGLAGIYIP